MAKLTLATADGFVVTDDPFLEPLLPRFIALAADRRLPAVYPYSSAVRQGGFMSYSANFFAMFRRAAAYVDRIHPADLPIEQATEVALDINLKTAKALGLTLPLTLLAIANEVIE